MKSGVKIAYLIKLNNDLSVLKAWSSQINFAPVNFFKNPF